MRKGKILRMSGMAACLAVLLAASGCKMVISENDVFRPQRVTQDRGPLAMEREDTLRREFAADVSHSLETFGGQPIAVTEITRGGKDPMLVSCSGNASDRVNSGANYAAKLLPYGDVILFDLPGYGDSPGRPTVDAISGMAPDFVAWVDAKAGERPLIFWGHSLGGFVCAELASQSSAVDAIILETTARNVREVAKAWKPWWAPLRLRPEESLEAFDTAEALSGFPGPVLVIGAGRDSVLPVELHRSLAESIPAPLTRYIELPDATHYSAGFDPGTVKAVEEMVAQISR